MNTDRLFALYDRVADAPDAVGRLRQFVLDLAVRGKLVGQDPADEPASELLKRIAVEKARLVKAGEIRKPRALKPLALDVDESSLSLPKGWEWAPLAGISYVTMGQSPPGDTYNRSGDGVPLINGPVEFTAGPFGRTIVNQFTTAPTKLCQEGDLLICVRGSTTGRTNVAAFRACIGRGVAAICSSFDDEFIRLFLWKVREDIISMGRGIVFPSVSKKQLENLAIPLPPLAEQHRIVANVDELMALCDRLEEARTVREDTRDRLTKASLARLSAADTDVPTFRSHARFAVDALPALTARADQVKHLRQTILSLAVRGKLVEQDPADEPASELLKRIAEDKRQGAVSARDRCAGPVEPIDSTEMSSGLPSSWVWASFGDITISRDRERVPVSKAERENRAKIYSYYGASGIIDKIDGYLFDKPLLLIGEDGANLINRSTPIAFIARGKYWVNNHAHVLDGLSENYLQYLELFINATDLRPFVTGTAQPKMNQAKMNSIPVALPPLAEQYRIVAKVDALMALCHQLQASLSAADTTRHRLLGSLLREALRPAA